jgi:hypothetical protein
MRKRRVAAAAPKFVTSTSSHRSRYLTAALYVMALSSSGGPFGIVRYIMLNSSKGF